MSKRGITEAEKLLDAIGQLPEDMLEQALETEENETETRAYRRQRRHRREIIGGLAAAAVLCVVVLGKHDRDFVRQQQSVENQVYYRAIPGVQRISRRIRRTRQSRYGL